MAPLRLPYRRHVDALDVYYEIGALVRCMAHVTPS
jgi:hypothetical protein